MLTLLATVGCQSNEAVDTVNLMNPLKNLSRGKIKKSPISQYYIATKRILWKSETGVTNAERLLEENPGQTLLKNSRPVTTLTAVKDKPASVLLDFGVEIHGSVELFIPQSADKNTVRKVRIRFGESASEAMSELGGKQNAQNDHAIRDQVVILPWLGKKTVGPSGFRFVRIDNLNPDAPVELSQVRAVLQIRDIPYMGSFKSIDERLNKIWEVGAYTVQMRDSCATPNVGTASGSASATTNPSSEDPFGPLPISSSSDVHIDLALLEWILPTGTGTITCDVVMGTDPVLDTNGFLDASDADNSLIVDGLAVEEIDPPALAMDTVYYWQIAVFDDGSPAGHSPLYKFRTFDRYMEKLDRGLIAMNIGGGEVYIGWRLLKSDPYDLGFNVYRNDVKLNLIPITDSTNYLDTDPNLAIENTYVVRPVFDEIEGADSTFVLEANPPVVHDTGDSFDPAVYVSFPFTAAGGRSDTVERFCTGDLDGDGKVDYVVQHPRGQFDPGPGPGVTSETYKYAAFDHDGTFKWEVDLGQNIVLGTWWSPMTVFDLDGDGKAEVIARTMPLTPDYRNGVDVWPTGAVLTGPEYFTIWDGDTGAVRATGDWIARGNVCDWGDCAGNRSERHQIGIAYLDGVNPSLLVIRGIYAKMVVEAWDLAQDDTLTKRWTWNRANNAGGGFHSIRTGDVDGDGKDEIINGSICIDDDGTTLWDTGEGHGDRLQLTDIDPDRAGLEVWYIQETPSDYEHPQHLRDADDGSLIWYTGDDTYGDNGRGLVADLDPNVDGLECWSVVADGKLRSATGAYVSERPDYGGSWMCGRAYWWGADLLRELEHYYGRIVEWDYITDSSVRVGTVPSYTNADLCVGDIFGDWREELIYYHSTAGEIRVGTPMTVTSERLYTLRQDPIYRNDVSSSASGYFNSTYTSFYMGSDMAAPTPATMSFSSAPAAASDSSITMTATAATAYGHGGVEYFFDCVTPGGHDSLWQTSRTYVDTNLDASTQYTYKVKARGLSHWETAYSSGSSATTNAPDTTAPTPNPATFATTPYATGTDAIAMVATTGTDASGPVEYYFDETSGNPGATDSGWQTSPSYTDDGLTAGTQYTYTVQMRDSAATPNVGTASRGKFKKL